MFTDFSFAKLLDSFSVEIFESTVTGKHVPTAQFDVVQSGNAGDSILFSCSFSDVLFSRDRHFGVEPNRPIESTAFNVPKLELQSFLLDPKGGISTGPVLKYDLAKGTLVPEPSTWTMQGAGMGLFAFARVPRPRRSRSASG